VKTSPVAPPVEICPEQRVGAAGPERPARPTAYRLQRALDWVVLIAASPVLVPIGLLIGPASG
jgi:hypothetical protein